MLETKPKTGLAVFNEIAKSGVFVAFSSTDYKDSMYLLQQNNLRPLTYQEALVKIDQNPELKEWLKGKWFYLAGVGTKLSGYYTFNDEGKLAKYKEDILPAFDDMGNPLAAYLTFKEKEKFTKGEAYIENIVGVLKGSQPLSLAVLSGVHPDFGACRFGLSAQHKPFEVAPVAVGIRNDIEVPSGDIPEDKQSHTNRIWIRRILPSHLPFIRR